MAVDPKYDFVLRNAGLVKGTAAYSETYKRMKDMEKEEKGQRGRVVSVGPIRERNTRMAQVLAALPAYNDMARAILSSVSPIKTSGGSRQ